MMNADSNRGETSRVKLTEAQRALLERTALSGSCTAYRCDTVTVEALTRRGLVTWRRNGGTTYGPGADTAWVTITPAGRAALSGFPS